MKRFLLLLLFFTTGFSFQSNAQVSIKDSSVFAPMVCASYGFQFPAGDLAKRFGQNSNIGLSFLIKDKKSFVYGISGTYLFGNKLREDGILDSINTSTGQIINASGEFAEVRLFERGFSAHLHFGKLFSVLSPNPNSGILVTAGAGFLQHKIRIDDIGNNSPQLSKEYRKGYDRLTNGFSTTQFLGYVFLSNKRLVNFYGGFEFIQAFTQSRRSWDFDLMRRDTQKRFDMLYGFRLGWILPLYKKAPDKYYYF